jgi:hypothetical protein
MYYYRLQINWFSLTKKKKTREIQQRMEIYISTKSLESKNCNQRARGENIASIKTVEECYLIDGF